MRIIGIITVAVVSAAGIALFILLLALAHHHPDAHYRGAERGGDSDLGYSTGTRLGSDWHSAVSAPTLVRCLEDAAAHVEPVSPPGCLCLTRHRHLVGVRCEQPWLVGVPTHAGHRTGEIAEEISHSS